MNDWISVKDKLPNDNQHIIMKGNFFNSESLNGIFYKYENNSYEFYLISGNKKYATHGITHWKPISKQEQSKL